MICIPKLALEIQDLLLPVTVLLPRLDNITKEDASSPTVSSEAVMLTCVIDATKKRNVAVVDISIAFIPTVVEDEKDRAFIHIRGLLVDILGSIAPDVYGPYVTVGKKGEK